MSTEATVTRIDRDRVKELAEREAKRLEESTQGSKRMFERAHEVMPLGVPSSYHARDPWPIYIERGEGAQVWDVDGRQLWDFHNGFGSMVMGHAHPAIVKAVSDRVASGRTSPRRPRTASSLPRNSRAASGCPSGASRTRARRRQWTPSESLGG